MVRWSFLVLTALFVSSAALAQPNFIVILTDDQGYDDLSAHHPPGAPLRTPTMDSIRSASVQFTNFYVAPLCAPTRAMLLTGRHYLKTGVYGVHGGQDYLNLDETTIAEPLRKAGYVTAHFGKWHSGKTDGYHAWQRGFDESYTASLYHYVDNTVQHNGTPLVTSGFVEERLADFALQFITDNADKPFFIYYCPLTCHTGEGNYPGTGHHAPTPYVDHYQNQGLSEDFARLYGSLEFLDDQLERILLKLDELDLTDNTYVILLSDNGPAKSGLTQTEWEQRNPSALAGEKSSVFENGIRSFLFVSGPGIVPGTVDALTDARDLFPTVLELAGVTYQSAANPLGGFSMTPLLQTGTWPHDDRVSYFSKLNIFPVDDPPDLNGARDILRPQSLFDLQVNDPSNEVRNVLAVRRGDYKLFKDDLYDMTQPEGRREETPISNPAIRDELKALAQDWWNQEVVNDTDSFRKPENVIRAPGQTSVQFNAINAFDLQSTGNVTIENHQVTGFENVDDALSYKILNPAPGIFRPMIRTSQVSDAKGTVLELAIGTHAQITAGQPLALVEAAVATGWSTTFDPVQLPAFFKEDKVEARLRIKAKSANGTVFDQVKKVEFILETDLTPALPTTDPLASPETVTLFQNLKQMAPDYLIYGQHHAYFLGDYVDETGNTSDMKVITGSHPGVVGFDFGRSSKWSPTVTNTSFHRQTVEAFKRGNVITYSWHADNPVTGGNYNDTDGNPVQRILTIGDPIRTEWIQRLDDISDYLLNLEVNGRPIPVIFRPYHENSGSWFWWGADHCTPAEFKELWQFTYQYIVETRGVRNLLWAYSPSRPASIADYLERYPGDSLVDIIGFDFYGDADGDPDFISNLLNSAVVVTTLAAERGKVAACTESGEQGGFANTALIDWFSRVWLQPLSTDWNARNLAYLMTWNSPDWSTFENGTNGHLYADFIQFFNDPFTVFENTLPFMYADFSDDLYIKANNASGQSITLEFEGLLESSSDLSTWDLIIPQPASGDPVDASASRVFFRSTSNALP
jgi:arylsulfatase A-like enzyme